MAGMEAVISDFGGVLTTPLVDSFSAFHESSGISLEHLGRAIAAVAAEHGANPLYELETGRLTEQEFLGSLAARLSDQLQRPIELDEFGERYFATLKPNPVVIDYMRELRGRGYKLAICTNNVREWEARWRAMLPIDEIFDVVIDSAFVGTRKPEPRIYELTLERLGVSADAALFIDDVQDNCRAAQDLGLRAVWFQTTEQAIAEAEAILGAAGS
jgi:epoxide hydrolase-like predicted phosphatase